VVEPDDLGGGAVGIEDGGDQPVDPGLLSRARGDGDLAADDANLDPANAGHIRAVAQPAADRKVAAGLDPDQQLGAGVGDRGDQRLGGEVPVGQHDHAAVQGAQQVPGIAGLPDAARAERGVDDGAGTARDQRQHADHRISGAAEVAPAPAELPQVRRGVRAAHRGAVDRGDQPATPVHALGGRAGATGRGCAAEQKGTTDPRTLPSYFRLLNTSQQFGHDVSERLRPASFSWVAVEADATPALRRRQVASVFTKRINRCGGHGPPSELNGSI
jgi:hypothetical protein